QAKGSLPQRAVSLTDLRRHLGKGQALTLPLDGHAASDLLVGGAQPGELALEGKVLCSKQLDLIPEAADRRLESGRDLVRFQQPPGEPVARLPKPRLDLAGPQQVDAFLLRIGRVGRVGDARQSRGLTDETLQLGPVPEPSLEVQDRPGGELLVTRRDVLPGSENQLSR